MKRFGIFISLFLMGTISFSMQVVAENQRVVNVYHWHNMIPQDVLDQFTMETGIKVHMDVYDSNDVLETKLLVGHTGYDVVGPSALPYVARQVPAGIYLPLNKEKLPILKELDPKIMAYLEKADPGNKHAVPFLWGLVGFAYDQEKIEALIPDAPTDSWAMMFDPKIMEKLSHCGVTYLTESTDIFVPVQLYLGLKPDSHDPKDLQKVVGQLEKVRPFIERFDAIRPPSELLAGEVCLSMLWVGDMERVKDAFADKARADKIKVVIPKEGTVLWIDCLAVPVDAPHPEEAYAFINFVMRPDIIARITNKNYFANPVPASLPFVKETLRQNSAFFPDETQSQKIFINEPTPPGVQRKINRAMTKVRTGR
ncbi:MAG: extracellular solute-binding protein [Alphaproteobacteria bacterium]|nr:extracellular solute-binding protein [Alphaproteobacteria bacterium]